MTARASTPLLNYADSPLFAYERAYAAEGFQCIAGVDEVGRGALYGPVTVCAVVFPVDGCNLPPVRDSKMLTAHRRLELCEELLRVPGFRCAFFDMTAKQIDQLDILQATMAAMTHAVEQLDGLDFALIDGNKIPKPFPIEACAIVDGDTVSASIAAASILAKVRRDTYMTACAKEFPEYGFEKHKGYATAEHLRALEKYGPLPEHRRSFAPVHRLIAPYEQSIFDM